jgi:superfamily I DNA/RNA helicase
MEKELKEGVPESKLAFLTFSRAARTEALSRTGKTEVEFPYIRTIHSICYQALDVSKDQIVKPQNLVGFGLKLGVRLTGINTDPWIEEFNREVEQPTRDDILIQTNHNGRHRRIMLKEAMKTLPFDIDMKYAIWLTKAYREWKTANGMLDYTDLLDQYLEFGEPLDIDVMFIDEAQDLSMLQWEVVFKLGSKAKRWYIAGDDDQAIFNWAGADSRIFQALRSDDKEILNQSFRLSKEIHTVAMNIVKRIRSRLDKEYSPTESQGEVRAAGFLGDLDFSQKTFILFRNHYRSSAITDALIDQKIPFLGKASPLADNSIRNAIFAYQNLLVTQKCSTKFLPDLLKFIDPYFIKHDTSKKIKEKSELSISEVFTKIPTLSIKNFCLYFSKMPNVYGIVPYIRRAGLLKTARPNIEVLSIHQSKGREAHTVVIDPEMSKAVWLSMMWSPDDEHRVWYVGVTRAKERLLFMMPDGRFSYKF